MYVLKEYLKEETELIRDPIYGFIELPHSLKEVVDHILVQRLRWISQLPLEQLVYPSAQHSRFEHSLGTMYLAMQVAISLVHKSFELLKEAKDEIQELRGLSEDDFKKIFILSAGLIGLLHDVGHAPFSHTLEDAFNFYTFKKDITFNHETLSFLISKNILFSIEIASEIKSIVLEVLNKKKKLKILTGISKVLRSLIDGPIDVDKGDYLLRDSYHCGVIYGIYDKDRLWRHVLLSEDFTLCVSEKGALEAWSLRFARYKMFKNVYKHHVRNITDALLGDAIARCLEDEEILKDEKIKDSLLRGIYPFQNWHLDDVDQLNEMEVAELSLWTDDGMLKSIDKISRDFQIREAQEDIQRFKSRKLPKRFLKVPLTIYSIDKTQIQKLRKVVENFKEICGTRLFFMWFREPPFPLYDEDTLKLKVKLNEGGEISIVEFLGFDVNEETMEEKVLPSHFVIQIFADEGNSCANMKDKIEKEVKEIFEG